MVLSLAQEEAQRFNHNYIGTEHILLGLIREGEGIAADMLDSLGLTLEQVRAETLRVLSQRTRRAQTQVAPEPPESAVPKNNIVTCQVDDRTLDTLDTLVEAGIRATRGEAAAWLIAAGIEANSDLLARINAKFEEVRHLRAEAQATASEVAGNQETPPPPRDEKRAEEAPPRDAGAEKSTDEDEPPTGM